MKRMTLVMVIGALILGPALVSVVAAQEPGKGQGAGAGQQGQPCPYGYEQPGGQQLAWWTQVQPATPEQKAFVGEVARIHEQIRTQRLELARLRADNAPQNQIAQAQAGVDAARAQLQNVMIENRELRRQMGISGMGRGFRGAGAGRIGQPCPYGNDQTGAGLGGWWNRVDPQTPQQQAFVDDTKALHAEVRAMQLELADLKSKNAPEAEMARVQAQLDGLRDEMQNLMYQNRELRQQMAGPGMRKGGGPADCQYGPGPGQNRGGGRRGR